MCKQFTNHYFPLIVANVVFTELQNFAHSLFKWFVKVIPYLLLNYELSNKKTVEQHIKTSKLMTTTFTKKYTSTIAFAGRG
jgi:K+-transporting ATPase A subunit